MLMPSVFPPNFAALKQAVGKIAGDRGILPWAVEDTFCAEPCRRLMSLAFKAQLNVILRCAEADFSIRVAVAHPACRPFSRRRVTLARYIPVPLPKHCESRAGLKSQRCVSGILDYVFRQARQQLDSCSPSSSCSQVPS